MCVDLSQLPNATRPLSHYPASAVQRKKLRDKSSWVKIKADYLPVAITGKPDLV